MAPQRRSSDDPNQIMEIPLFPLDLVLFPQMLVPLYIFEERYKIMINRCWREKIPFGIVLITGEDDDGAPETSRVGCTARISRVERLPDGRMNIEVMGESRFRLLEAHDVLPYRTGLVAPYDDSTPDPRRVQPLTAEVKELLHAFLTLYLERIGQRVTGFELPEDPEALSFTAACVLPIANEEKQALLEHTDTAARLSNARAVLSHEVEQLRRETPQKQEWTPVGADAFARYYCSN